MIWYFKNKQSYKYPSNQLINNTLTWRFQKSVYEHSEEMELYKSFQDMKNLNIPALSVILPLNELSVNYGNLEDINKDFCDANNIIYRFENRGGGCMVLFPGNIITHDVYPTDNFLRQHAFCKDFVDWLATKNILASTNNNDVMIEDKKIIGTVSYVLPEPYLGWTYFLSSISINSDTELIKNICTKPSIKTPGALSDYGITTEEVMEWVLNWFNNHKYEDEQNL